MKGPANRTEVDHGRKSCGRSEDVELIPWEEVAAGGLHENASYRISRTTLVQTILRVTRVISGRTPAVFPQWSNTFLISKSQTLNSKVKKPFEVLTALQTTAPAT